MFTRETRLSNTANDESTIHLAFTSTVLALRGDHIARQPFVDPQSESIFCWNGEAWKIRHHDVAGNDGETIANLLNQATRCDSPDERETGILKVLRSIDGPFAFVFFDKPSKRVYFGRDRLGRRSLLLQVDSNRLVLSSIADSVDPSWKEVEADGVYVVEIVELKLGNGESSSLTAVSRRAWLEGEDEVDFVSCCCRQALCALQRACRCPATNHYRYLPLEGSTTRYRRTEQCWLQTHHQ